MALQNGKLLVATASRLSSLCPSARPVCTSGAVLERFGTSNGDSGWKWEKGGIGMGGKDKGLGTEAKPDCGKRKTYQVPEYFQYNAYSYFDFEKDMLKKRCPQPKSGLSEFW